MSRYNCNCIRMLFQRLSQHCVPVGLKLTVHNVAPISAENIAHPQMISKTQLYLTENGKVLLEELVTVLFSYDRTSM